MQYLRLNLGDNRDTDLILLLKLFIKNYLFILFFTFIFLLIGILYNKYYLTYTYKYEIKVQNKDLVSSNFDSFFQVMISRKNLVNSNYTLYLQDPIEREYLYTELFNKKDEFTSGANYNFDDYDNFVDHVFENLYLESDNIIFYSHLDNDQVRIILQSIMGYY